MFSESNNFQVYLNPYICTFQMFASVNYQLVRGISESPAQHCNTLCCTREV